MVIARRPMGLLSLLFVLGAGCTGGSRPSDLSSASKNRPATPRVSASPWAPPIDITSVGTMSFEDRSRTSSSSAPRDIHHVFFLDPDHGYAVAGFRAGEI